MRAIIKIGCIVVYMLAPSDRLLYTAAVVLELLGQIKGRSRPCTCVPLSAYAKQLSSWPPSDTDSILCTPVGWMDG